MTDPSPRETSPDTDLPGRVVSLPGSAWDPGQYAHFGDHRERPFHELVARIGVTAPNLIIDLGCGSGGLTVTLADRWPQARVVGVDSSTPMLDAARTADAAGRVEWVEATAQEWDPAAAGGSVDLLVTNATLQWVPSHLRLIPAWLAALTPGGTFAMQVPANFDAPSHRLMREVAARHPRADDLAPGLDRAAATARPETYAALLLELAADVDVWQTTYLQVLPVTDDGTHPVLDWVRGTGLRPVLGVLTDPAEREAFETEYAAELENAYPTKPFGVLFPFTRTFAVARAPTM